LGSGLLLAGDPEAGLAALEQAVALDPRSRVVGHNHAWTLFALGREAEARAACQRVLDFAPDYDGCLEALAVSALLRGELDVAAPLLDRLATTMDLGGHAAAKELVEAFAGRGDRDALARRLGASDPMGHLVANSGVLLEGFHTPALLVGLGRNDLAIDFVERIMDMEGDDAGWALVAPELDAIRCDPRIIAAFEGRNARDPRAEALCRAKP
jgi:tetratricopeptide (TPR) repeat protein